MSPADTRRGALLVVVAGLSALMASLVLAFVVRMRADTEDAHRLAQDIQARVMLSAGLMYVQETSRIGWRTETFGWRDVRDGLPGPRAFDGAWPPMLVPVMADNGTARPGAEIFPAIRGRAARHPMYVMTRPPFAIKPTITPNPVPLVSISDPSSLNASWASLVNYTVPDPQPVRTDPGPFRDGDRRPLNQAGIPAWYRVYRSGVTTFVVTCGAGASRGYRDWPEVELDGAQEVFGSEAEFKAIRAAETLLWYEAEWTDAITGNNFLHGHWQRFNVRSIGSIDMSWAESPNRRQFAGTFLWIARLPGPPDDGKW